jgi:hypothetical protein
VLGYHPLVATRADTGEILHARLRKGSSQRGVKRFCEELVARVRRCGATGPLALRADAGFFSWELIGILTRLCCRFSITVHVNKSVKKAISAIAEDEWCDIVYPAGGAAQVAETTYVTLGGASKRKERGQQVLHRIKARRLSVGVAAPRPRVP